MIQIQDLTKTEKLSSNAMQAIKGGRGSRFTSFSYANIGISYFSSWGVIGPNNVIGPNH